jgi:hypothetical protein
LTIGYAGVDRINRRWASKIIKHVGQDKSVIIYIISRRSWIIMMMMRFWSRYDA